METIYDVIGIGFGPSNLALAVALEEENPQCKKLFIESKDRYVWHPGMLMDNTNIQISFLKDLVTLRNPRSNFSFLNYLFEKGRLKEFINLSDFYPARPEYNDYMSWVANFFEKDVRYSNEVLSIDPVEQGGEVNYLTVNILNKQTSKVESIKTKGVILGTGSQPYYPGNFSISNSQKVFHSSNFLHNIKNYSVDGNYKFAVVGSGQSSAEIFRYLISNFKNADTTAIMRSFSYKAVNESKLINQIFDADMIDFYYDLPQNIREKVINSYRDTNYNVADTAIINELNKAFYNQKFQNKDDFRILPYTELKQIITKNENVELHTQDVNTGEESIIQVDAAILATGYVLNKGYQHPLLANLQPYIVHDNSVQRDYTVPTIKNFNASVILQGCNEYTHGLGDTLLSNLAIRSNEIAKTLNEHSNLTKEKVKI
ncbi:SidA/IucD/PvdA family monooxygenase [Niallia taxi]|uniref:lysine N(6)-hydroxylase/L-ornithine N(5)-oxygenase family protein n=1 Tax=Niallia taxi TaxID=2499688 RepID=UPI00203EE4C0|nr:SidA/IucD/PvdA family monooxygenase [Niallia taxi]MCM3216678.1 lysine N(6)-hydroxylase/L-ornithine N(5)-oxygenase family protein [Niallia taxi]